MARDILPSAPRDRHVRRSGDDYVEAFFSLLPRGRAWPRSRESTLARVIDALARFWGYVDGRAADLLERESDPQQTVELLPEWERAWGLPDPCFPEATTVGERQQMLVTKMIRLGGQSREYFIDVIAWVGFRIRIHEWAPFMTGISRVGDTRPLSFERSSERFRWYIGPPEMRFVWTAQIGHLGLAWFRVASSEVGVNSHLEYRTPFAVECLLNRWKPAHTHLAFNYSSIDFDDPMEGTP